MDRSESLRHTKWDSKYHLVFIPKFRRKTPYRQLTAHLGDVLRTNDNGRAAPAHSHFKESNMSQNKHFAAIGRLLLASLFILSGFSKIGAPEAKQGYIASVGLPVPMLAYLAAIVAELGDGILLMVGYRARVVSLILAAFTVVTAPFFHRSFGDQNQMIHFLKNIAIAGGLLQIAAFGAGSVSLDARRLATA